VLGGSRHRVDSLIANQAAWSPDGRQLVYSRGDGLYVASADGTASRKLATLEGSAPAFMPRWSPDGKTIRFSIPTSVRGGTSIWEVSAEGTGLHRLLVGWNNPSSECCGVWTPDGKYFFFLSQKGDGTGNIWAIREGRSLFYEVNDEPVQLSAGPAAMFLPLPSLDGKKLFVITSVARGKLVHYDVSSGEFLPSLNGISATCVDFSKDGRWITYVQYPEATLWRSKADGSDKVRLTVSPMTAWNPRWSPDGMQIAFIGITPEQGIQSYLIAADGTGTPELIPAVSGEAGEIDANWSPDGRSLVFSGAPAILTANKSSSTAIHIMEMSTRKVKTLSGSEGLFSSRWSPDGRYLAAMTSDSRRLMVYDLSAER
jgi:Tol biopolymer transport system component